MRALLLTVVALPCACTTSSPRPHRPPAIAPVRAMPTPFLPADYVAEIFTDFDAMRRNGVLDHVERLPMVSSWLQEYSRSYGCDFDDLQCVRTAVVFGAAKAANTMRVVSVAAVDPSAAAVPMPAPWQPWEQDGVRGCQFAGGAFPALVVRPEQGIVVAGERDLIVPQLAGPAGGPHPELRQFAAGERLLFQYAAGTFGRRAHTVTGTVGFFGHDDPDDPCEFLRLRLAEDAEGGLVLSAALRYRPGSANLRRTEIDLRAFLDRTAVDPEFRAVKPLIDALVITHDERDMHVSLALGEPRDAIRTVERAVVGMIAASNARRRR